MDPTGELALRIGLPLALLVLAYFTGAAVERRHYASIRKRELRWRGVPAVTFRSVPPGWQVAECALITGSVVISVDYFKRFLAGLR
ncbi:MAG: YbjQ family protein, partial [Deltaproteobacteria bacterium]|nr:YbjQ family protein [Deltaproteobacteria bacterium]